ncbi:MAG: hypothetical protein ACR2NU_05265 [Aeoliella sp.]
MLANSRRHFMKRVGSGMLIAGLGSNLAVDLGVAAELDQDEPLASPYGSLGKWVARMQELQPDRLQAEIIEALGNRSVDLRELVSAAALANAETFGGQDYVGYHAEMALVPALEMADDLPLERKPLPVLKVIYRNSSRIQKFGPTRKTLKPITANEPAVSVDRFGPELRDLVRQADMAQAEQLFANVHKTDPNAAFDTLLYTIADEVDVHRFVLAYRGMSLIDIAGEDHSHTMLRQCVRHCVDFEKKRVAKGRKASPIREHIPKLFVEFGLDGKSLGDREPDDGWLETFANMLYSSTKFEASSAVAEALADGVAPKSICQAIAMACNHLTLRQSGDPLRTHGASAGVHSSDAANAWRHMISHANELNGKVGLLVSAWHTGRYDQWSTDPYPLEEHFEEVQSEKETDLLGICEEAIRGNDQGTAAAAVQRYGELGFPAKPVFDLMLKYAVSEDGRLHSEKFYRTVKEEFEFSRPAFRWRQLVALARVTASAFAYDVQDNHGHRAPGYLEACEVLKVVA